MAVTRSWLALTEACTLLARETVSLLEGDVIVSPAAVGMRDTLALISGTPELADGGALLAWVDRELDATRRLVETGEKTDSLMNLPRRMPPPSGKGMSATSPPVRVWNASTPARVPWPLQRTSRRW
ncbi:hypothetical protein [uncultured Oscillibacter sp.]|uniref:hypothetical protein n=1 Tax=uncultured Oscillibacter sp. TaxID=876091 RepID=UPI002612BCDB|nr:hypothetical protein [uncultured Oscillibacter sp.]